MEAETLPTHDDPGLEREYEEDDNDDFDSYRSLSMAAVASLVVAFLGLIGLVSWQMLFVPFLGAVLGGAALLSIRRNPDEMTGATLAWIGLVISVVTFIGGSTYRVYEYNTEIPDPEMVRISFSQLKPDLDDQSQGNEFPPEVAELVGKKVFVKGYIHPGVQGQGKVQEFVMVGDLGTCCFGKQPELTHMIEVSLQDDLTAEYSYRKIKIGGVFEMSPPSASAPGKLKGGIYKVKATHIR